MTPNVIAVAGVLVGAVGAAAAILQYLDDSTPKALEGFATSFERFGAAVASGDFVITPEGAQRYRESLDDLNRQISVAATLQDIDLPLGTIPGLYTGVLDVPLDVTAKLTAPNGVSKNFIVTQASGGSIWYTIDNENESLTRGRSWEYDFGGMPCSLLNVDIIGDTEPMTRFEFTCE